MLRFIDQDVQRAYDQIKYQHDEIVAAYERTQLAEDDWHKSRRLAYATAMQIIRNTCPFVVEA